MTFTLKPLILFTLLFLSCNTGKLEVITDLPYSLKEASAIETVYGSDLLWTIEDAGNKNNIYGLNLKGEIIKDINIRNAKNIDWEDLTSDKNGNIYIGDLGNNDKKRKKFTIYRVKLSEVVNNEVNAVRIDFQLPKGLKSEDFEGLFILDNFFYIFSKEKSSSLLLKVPNKIGLHIAELITDFNLDGKHHKITSAAISPNEETVVLLNHDKIWVINNFKPDSLFKGDIKVLKFDHNSQKEGVCFKDNETVYISDERKGINGGNLYKFNIN